jgi:Predicted membrane protein (DUF2142)
VLVLALVVVAGLAMAAVAARGLAEKQPRRSGTNSVFPGSVVAELKRGQHLCQAAIVAADTRVIEIPFAREAFPRDMTLIVRDESRKVVATARPKTVRARATRFVFPRTIDHDVGGSVCLIQGRGPTARVLGDSEKKGMTVNDLIVAGGISMAYYRPGEERLISMVPVVAQRIGRTRGLLGGTWRAVTVVLLLVASVGLAAWGMRSLLRGRRRRIALIVALVAGLNTLAWGLLVPAIQIPDEHFHLSYVQDLAEHHKPPAAYVDQLSEELNVIVSGAALGDINFNPVGRGFWSPDAEQKLDRALAKKPNTDNEGASINLRDYPPAYYATLVPIYWTVHAAGGSTLDALTFMRAQGALLAIVTALALLALLRELWPDRPLLTGGVALICAFQPVFTWISGGVNPDGMLIALGAVLFWLFARAFRRGLNVRTAVAIGLVLALMGLTKFSALGFLPGTVLGIGLLLWRRTPPGGWFRPALAAALAAGLPVLVYTIVNRVVWGRSIFPGGITAAARGASGDKAEQASSFLTYLWQYVLPPIGSMTDFFRVGWTPKDFWTPLFVGRFGWFDYQFPDAVNTVAFVAYSIVAVAALVALVPRLRREWILWVIFGALTAGLVVAIARAGYPLRAGGNYLFEQTRYFLPLIGLYALSLGLAFSLLRGRALAVVTSVVVGVSSVHLLAAFVLTVRRYYL